MNFNIHLHLRELTAGDSLSLKENVSLLCTFIALSFLIIKAFGTKVNILSAEVSLTKASFTDPSQLLIQIRRKILGEFQGTLHIRVVGI